MKNKETYQLSKEKKAQMSAAIQRYFSSERQEELGDLAASMMLDFFIDELAPEFYNKGVADSHQYMSDRIEDLLDIQKY